MAIDKINTAYLYLRMPVFCVLSALEGIDYALRGAVPGVKAQMRTLATGLASLPMSASMLLSYLPTPQRSGEAPPGPLLAV